MRKRRSGSSRKVPSLKQLRTAPEVHHQESDRYERRDGKNAARRPTDLQMDQRRAYVERLYLAGGSSRQIQAMAVEALQITTKQAHYVIELVRQDVTAAFEQDRSSERASAADRLKTDLLRMRTFMTTTAEELIKMKQERPTWNDIVRHEQMLARITGTLAPIRVQIDTDIRVRESLIAVVGGMGRQDMENRIAELEEQDRNPAVYETTGSSA